MPMLLQLHWHAALTSFGACHAQHKALDRSSQSLNTGPSGPKDRDLPFVIADRGKAVELSASNLKTDRCVSQSNTPLAVLPPKTAGTTNTHTGETTPAPGPKSEAASRMASADMSCQDSPDSSHRAQYKGGEGDSILFAQGPSGGGMNAAGLEMIAHGDHVVKADVGWTSKPHAEPRAGGQTSFWAAMTGRENVRSVPLRPLGHGSNLGSLPFPGEHTQAGNKRDVQERQLQGLKNPGRASSSQYSDSSCDNTPPRTARSPSSVGDMFMLCFDCVGCLAAPLRGFWCAVTCTVQSHD